MKIFRSAALLVALLLAASPALAQWQTPNHSVPLGRGVGVTGFGSVVPSIAGRPFIDNGAGLDPGFGSIANSGFAPGAANTAKGTLDGVSVTDLPLPSCTGVNQAWRYVNGVGINCGTVTVTTGFDTPINFGLTASAAGGNLTINATQANGSAPTSTNPILASFRSLTLTSGLVTYGSIPAASSLVIPAGATLATTNGVPFRLWIFLVANGGATPALGVATCSNPTAIFPCTSWEGTLKTTITINASAGTGGTLYTAAGVTLDSVRIVGYCDFANGLPAVGTWGSACTTLQVFGPGIKKPGDVVRNTIANTTTVGSTASASFVALTSGPTLPVTLNATPNLLRLTCYGTMTVSANANAFIQLARDTTLIGNPVGYGIGNSAQSTSGAPAVVAVFDSPGDLTTHTYTMFGKTSANTLTYPVTGSGSLCEAQEIQG